MIVIGGDRQLDAFPGNRQDAFRQGGIAMAAVGEGMDVAVGGDPPFRRHFPEQLEGHRLGFPFNQADLRPGHAPFKTTARVKHIIPGRKRQLSLTVTGVTYPHPQRHPTRRLREHGLQSAIRFRQGQPGGDCFSIRSIKDRHFQPGFPKHFLDQPRMHGDWAHLDIIQQGRSIDHQDIFPILQSPRGNSQQAFQGRFRSHEDTDGLPVEQHRPSLLDVALPDPEGLRGGIGLGLKTEFQAGCIHWPVFETLPLPLPRLPEMQPVRLQHHGRGRPRQHGHHQQHPRTKPHRQYHPLPTHCRPCSFQAEPAP